MGQPSNREFWKVARAFAKERLAGGEGEQTELEDRCMHLHEALWIEELGTMLDLHDARGMVETIDSGSRDGLFVIDVTSLLDGISGSSGTGSSSSSSLLTLLEKGGIVVRIKSASGASFDAFPQAGGAAGLLQVSSSPDLAEASGPFSLEFRTLRFQERAKHLALDSPSARSILLQASKFEERAEKQEAKQQQLPPSLNGDQRRAIAAALQMGRRQQPLLVWGPPGTGKSTLAAFMIWHLVNQSERVRVLVAAPSNTAADVLCSKLAKLSLDKSQMMRLNALSRDAYTVPTDIVDFCFPDPQDPRRFAVPPLPQMRKFQVVVCTCICAAHLTNALRREAGSVEGWFSHVVVDEAAEALEPETLVPLSLLRERGSAVLLGDHLQLGPLVIEPLAKRVGELDISLMERLVRERFDAMHEKRLDEGSTDAEHGGILLDCEEIGLHFLTESYRSHESIMSLYSEMFYKGMLNHCQRQQQRGLEPFFRAHDLEEPLLLHHIVGKERQDPESRSLYNPDEVEVVKQYVTELLGSKELGLGKGSIGVISPYVRQVQELERQLRKFDVDCGTVEKFQGQERRVIIISTVRCRNSTPESQRRPIGFLADPKRLNVAISRAIAGLIVVGDLQTLARNSEHWRQLVEKGQGMSVLRGEPLGSLQHQEERAAQPAKPVVVTPEEPDAVSVAKAESAWDALTEK